MGPEAEAGAAGYKPGRGAAWRGTVTAVSLVRHLGGLLLALHQLAATTSRRARPSPSFIGAQPVEIAANEGGGREGAKGRGRGAALVPCYALSRTPQLPNSF